MKRTVIVNIEDLIDGQHLFEISKLFQRLHERYSQQYNIVCVEGFDIVGYS